MMFFVILFLSPLYFLLRGKWFAFVFNSLIYLIACGFVITIIFIWVAPFFWMLAVGHAMWQLRKETASAMIQEHAEVLATKMVEKMKHSVSQEPRK